MASVFASCYCMHICICLHIHKYSQVQAVQSVKCLLYVCFKADHSALGNWLVWFSLRKIPFSCSHLPLFVYSSSCRAEASWAYLCPLGYLYCYHPCSSHVSEGTCMRLCVCSLWYYKETHSHKNLLDLLSLVRLLLPLLPAHTNTITTVWCLFQISHPFSSKAPSYFRLVFVFKRIHIFMNLFNFY